MSIEEISRKSQEYQSKLMKYKLNIERYLSQSQGPQPSVVPPALQSNPAAFGSSLFRALPDESLAVSDSERPAEPTLIESNLLASSVEVAKEKHLLSEIDLVVAKIRSKGPPLPAATLLRTVERAEREQGAVIVNRRSPARREEAKPIKTVSSFGNSSELGRPDNPPHTSEPHPPLPPKPSRLKQAIGRYRETSQQSLQPRAEENSFELSQTAEHRSILSDLEAGDFEHEDSVLTKLQQEKDHLLREIRAIDEEIFTLQ